MRHVVHDVADDLTIACWAAVGVVWLVGALLGRWRGQPVRERTHRDVASFAVGALGVVALRTSASLWHSLTAGAVWLRIVGMLVLLPAALATVWARIALGAMWSAGVVRRERHELRTEGPYSITRHPIYSGVLAMLLGTALTEGGGRWIAVLVAATAILVLKLRAEERLMTREFPREYERYRRRVPALVPRLTRGR